MIKRCPTIKVLSDYCSKLLVGKLLRMMRSNVMNVVLRELEGRPMSWVVVPGGN